MTRSGKSSWLNQAPRLGLALLAIAALGCGVVYLSKADYEPDGFLWVDGPMIWVLVAWVVLTVVGLLSSTLDQIPWYGAIPAPVAEGYAWRRSIRSRFESMMNVANLWGGPGFARFGLLAWAHEDYGRAAVAGLLVVGFATLFCLSLAPLFSLKPVLIMDSNGLAGWGLPGGALAWDLIERLVVSGDLDERRVTVMTLREDGTPGSALTLELGAAGLPARTFLRLVEEVAPQVEVQWPIGRYAAFSEA